MNFFLYCRGSFDCCPPRGPFLSRFLSIRAADPYGAELLIDYHAESKSCGFCKHTASCSIDSFPHSTLALLFPTSPEAMGL